MTKRWLALSLRQPTAFLVVQGIVSVHRVARPCDLRGRILVHASAEEVNFLDVMRARQLFHNIALPDTAKFRRGAIVGSVEIVDCVMQHPSPWFRGPCGLVLANPDPWKYPEPCKGKRGFFYPEYPQKSTGSTSNPNTEKQS